MELRSTKQNAFKTGLAGYQYPLYVGCHKLWKMHRIDPIGLGLSKEQRCESQYRCVWPIPDYGTYHIDQKRKRTIDRDRYYSGQGTWYQVALFERTEPDFWSN